MGARRVGIDRACTRFEFTVTARDGAARRGELRTPHGVVQTPAFMPVGTRGAVKALTHRDVAGLGAEIILGNTYHLYLEARRRADRPRRRPASLHRLGPADPDRQRRLPDLQPRGPPAHLRARAPSSARTSTARCTCSPRSRSPTSSCSSAPTSRWCSTSASRRPAPEDATRTAMERSVALGAARADAAGSQVLRRPRTTRGVAVTNAGAGAVRHHPGRDPSGAAHRERRRRRSRSASRPTPSAG